MGEDRRPNVAGRDPRPAREQPSEDEERLRLNAKSLRARRGVDGHEGRSPADPEREEKESPPE